MESNDDRHGRALRERVDLEREELRSTMSFSRAAAMVHLEREVMPPAPRVSSRLGRAAVDPVDGKAITS